MDTYTSQAQSLRCWNNELAAHWLNVIELVSCNRCQGLEYHVRGYHKHNKAIVPRRLCLVLEYHVRGYQKHNKAIVPRRLCLVSAVGRTCKRDTVLYSFRRWNAHTHVTSLPSRYLDSCPGSSMVRPLCHHLCLQFAELSVLISAAQEWFFKSSRRLDIWNDRCSTNHVLLNGSLYQKGCRVAS